MKIGIIGAENSHATRVSVTVNVEKAVKGVSVEYLWGETAEFAKKTAEAGKIPNIVKNVRDMLGKVDGIMVDHRHGKFHLPAALPFVEAGVPAFIDKPFCYRSGAGREFLRIARQKGTPVTSFSTTTLQRSFRAFKRKLDASGRSGGGAVYGPADLKSPYGGLFFYGIHQVEIALETFGYDIKTVRMTKSAPDRAAAQLIYGDGSIVTLNLVRDLSHGFAVMAFTEKGPQYLKIKNDANPYLTGTRAMCKMFKTGVEPRPHEQILKTVLVLEAMDRALKSGAPEKVGR